MDGSSISFGELRPDLRLQDPALAVQLHGADTIPTASLDPNSQTESNLKNIPKP